MKEMTATIGEIGEKALLQRLRKYLNPAHAVIRTFSEDCAVIEVPGDYYHLYTVDVLVEGVHFRKDCASAFFIGRKAIKVNLSDVSAMAGEPLCFLLSLGAPSETPVELLEAIYEGIESVTKDSGVSLIGGNVSNAPFLFLDITLIGRARKEKVVFRNGARKGDSIFVTGKLGASAEGLKLLNDGFRISGSDPWSVIDPGVGDTSYARECILAHLDPPLYTRFAKELPDVAKVNAMIDLSDGLASDLPEICRESNVGARIEVEKVPISPGALYWETKRNLDAAQLALNGGEDYHLLFTASPGDRANLMDFAAQHHVELAEIGKIVDASEGISTVTAEGRASVLARGFEHFQ
jgi:thiamine-monophosphate kinase